MHNGTRGLMRASGVRMTAGVALVLAVAGGAAAQGGGAPAQPSEKVSFQEAVARAVQRNATTAIASAGILRADALLQQARAASGFQLNASVTTQTLNTGVDFGDVTVQPQNQLTLAADARYPLYAPTLWARRVQAEDGRRVAELNAADVKRQIAVATANAYLAVITQRRVVEANERARETAKAHFDLAHELQEKGSGSRLNELRAQQEFTIDQGFVESAKLGLYRAQAALGVLLVADGPVDVSDEPVFDAPPATDANAPGQLRSDLKLFAATQQAAERVVADTRTEYLPSLQAIFQPQSVYPSGAFSPANSFRFLVQASIPLWDNGQRAASKVLRQAVVDQAKAVLENATTLARAEVRTAQEAVKSAERSLATARAAAEQAKQVLTITNVSFRAGAATNIEVIDAERRSRDADTSVAIAEDALRRATFDLLTAEGRFP